MKEVIWNISLLSLSILGALLFAINRKDLITFGVVGLPNTNITIHPFSVIWILGAGFFLGIMLILCRYIGLFILAIRHKDIQIALILVGYLIPIVVITLLVNYVVPQKNYDDNIPIEAFHNGFKELRTCCLFKSYKDKPDEFITSLGIGRLITKHDAWINYWDREKNNVEKRELLRLDTEKTWIRNDTEFVLEGNDEYTSVIKELEVISEGHFSPKDIVERWLSKDKVEISFQLGKDIHKIYPTVNNDWADMDSILRYVNNLMKGVDYQFYEADGGDILVIGLTSDEKERLTEALGIHFKKP